MSFHGRNNPNYRGGGLAGWKAFRYGAAKAPITLGGTTWKKPPPLNYIERNRLLDRVTALMDGYTASPFQLESACRHGIRSSLCLDGHAWGSSDIAASQVVAEALRRNGAVRPTWEQGQHEYVIPRENCAWCANPLDAGEMERYPTRRFCSVECGNYAWRSRQFAELRSYSEIAQQAYHLSRHAKAKPRPCLQCGKRFRRADNERGDFCSLKCFKESLKVQIPSRSCGYCDKVFTPASNNKSAKFCCKACADAALVVLPDRQCAHCHVSFRPQNRHQKFCSRECSDAAKAYRAIPKQCVCCGEIYPAKRNDSLYCSVACEKFSWNVRSGRKKSLDARVFDFVFRMAA